MTEKTKKRRKLFHEILGILAICFILSLILFLFVGYFSVRVIEEYCFNYDIELDELDYYQLDITMMSVGFVVSVIFFVVLFFILFAERLSYIRNITAGVHALRRGEHDKRVKLLGNNELTELAEAVNFLSESEKNLKEKEQKLSKEKEELIRALSHDIRTPLTSIMSYTEMLSSKEGVSAEEQRAYLLLVSQKTAQIKELTDILLDGGKRQVENFENARLLFEQLVAEFEEELEESFKVDIELSSLPSFSGSFDVGEMRRVFDNLISNVTKYADRGATVKLSVSKNDNSIVIRQSNVIKKDGQPSESHKMGLNSIRRIAQGYSGAVEVSEENGIFDIIITLSDI